MSTNKPRWVPLESNPDVMTKYIHNMGVPEKWIFVDVLGLDDELLGMIPRPVSALIVLFPEGEKIKSAQEEMCARIEKEGQELSDKVYFMKQTIGNACGTIGVLHAVLNNQDDTDFKLGGLVADFAEKTKGMDGAARGAYLENDAGICEAHSSSAQEGQTQAPRAEESVKPHFVALVHIDGSLYELDGCKPFPVNHGKSSDDNFLQAPAAEDKAKAHFIALVSVDGCLYELDGRKSVPINHGKTTADGFVKDAAEVCKKIMATDPNELNFNIMALTGGKPLY